MNKKKLIPFKELSDAEKDKLAVALAEMRLEVSCPWWPVGHWERKLPNTDVPALDQFWDDAYYRIKE